ncbi:MAG: MBL fold metallo-hydrolase [Flavobacteriaceae bacterium]|nr:MBL fold metallo-hydrolase [Flavobacteriaceae bacterium]
MIVKQIYTSCLSHGAYFIASDGEAAVIDPLRDISDYIKLAKETNTKIKYIFETHFHADFISGHLTLAKATGALIVYGPKAEPKFEAIIANDNQVFKLGEVSLTVMHTPGHTLESSSYLLKDKFGNENSIFTGDTFFLGDVGIPDVAQRYMGFSKEELAGILYDSVNNKIKPLSDQILIYPGHGAGSACGKNMMKETVDTLSNQKKVNYSINGSVSREIFIKELTDDLPEPPAYFPSNVKLNIEGYKDIDYILTRSLNSLGVKDFKSLSKNDEIVILDVRNQDIFSQGFIPGSIFVGLNGQFAPWVGSVLKNIYTKILLVCENGKEKETITRLSRIGFDNVVGYLDGGFELWKKSNEEIDIIESVLANDLNELMNSDIKLIDVRAKSEREKGFLKESFNIPLNIIHSKVKKLDKSERYYIHCAGGYRSMIACSILKSIGFDSLFNIKGGFAEIRKSELQIV